MRATCLVKFLVLMLTVFASQCMGAPVLQRNDPEQRRY